MRAYAHHAMNPQLEMDAAEIRIRAERRLGEMIQVQEKIVGLRGPQHNTGAASQGHNKARPIVAEIGISKKLFAHVQTLAKIPESRFEEGLSLWRKSEADTSNNGKLNVVMFQNSITRALS